MTTEGTFLISVIWNCGLLLGVEDTVYVKQIENKRTKERGKID